jgi:hypothetical protein
MFTLVQIPQSRTAAADSASLMADYLAFDRQRTVRRQYMKAFGGMAVIVLFGALFNRVPGNEAAVVIGLLLAPPLVMAAIELAQKRRIVRRLDGVRADVRAIRKS